MCITKGHVLNYGFGGGPGGAEGHRDHRGPHARDDPGDEAGVLLLLILL